MCGCWLVHSSDLFHVGSADQLGAEEEALSVGLVQVHRQVVVGVLQVALVRVEHDRLRTAPGSERTLVLGQN